MKRMILVVLGVIICFCAACQATPENPLVVGKDQEKMIEQAKFEATPSDEQSGGTLAQKIGAPETYQTNIDKGKLKVLADASVSVSDVAMPIVRVSARNFTQEEVSAFFKEFCSGTKLYNESRQMTKSEIEKEIIVARKNAENAKNTPDDPDNMDMTFGGNAGYAKYLETEYIPQLEREYQNAPEKRGTTVADGILTLLSVSEGGGNSGTMMGVQAFENVGDWSAKGSPGKGFRAFNNPETLGKSKFERISAAIAYDDMSVGQVIIDTSPVTDEIEKKVGISAKEAQKQAEDILAKYNLPFAVSEVLFIDNSEYVAFKKEYPHPNDKGRPEKYGAGYQIRCVRVVNGASTAYMQGESEANTENNKEKFFKSWSYERITFLINADGIFGFDWTSPLTIQEIVLEKSELLPFEKIDSIFNKMMTVMYEPQANMYAGYDIKVDKIKLELMRIPEQNSIENGLLIPVWRFYGTRNSIDDNGEVVSLDSNRSDGCVIVINAIDGSIIDQVKGY